MTTTGNGTIQRQIYHFRENYVRTIWAMLKKAHVFTKILLFLKIFMGILSLYQDSLMHVYTLTVYIVTKS